MSKCLQCAIFAIERFCTVYMQICFFKLWSQYICSISLTCVHSCMQEQLVQANKKTLEQEAVQLQAKDERLKSLEVHYLIVNWELCIH